MIQPWRMVARVHGGPEVIVKQQFDPGSPGPNDVLIEQDVVGLNFIDIYYRTGLYPAPLPVALGSEGVGHIVAVGSAVEMFSIGDRVACASGLGAYATHRVAPSDRIVRVPDDIASEDVAAMMLKGMTACYLAEDILPLKSGQVALVHAAAGGVGSILVPWLRDRGIVVIAHSGSEKKASRVEADHSLHGSFDDLAGVVRELTGGQGVDVVYDGVGKDSWSSSLKSLKRRGLLVSYGNASGAVPPMSLLDLSRNGSLYVTRPTLADYVATSHDLTHAATRLFERMQREIIRANIGQRFKLEDAAEAHRALEARRTTGATILTL